MSDRNPQQPAEAAAAMEAAVARGKQTHTTDGRRPFLQRLGLKLPVTPRDVKQAYFAKANETHPDHGGDTREFLEVQQAFDEAIAFAKHSGKRLPWLGVQMPAYLAQREVVELVDTFGGETTTEHLDWLAETVGPDFAQLADRLTEIDLSGRDIGDDQLRLLLENNAEGLAYLRVLNLAATPVTDASVKLALRLPSIQRLDITGTKVSAKLAARLLRKPRVQQVVGAGFLARLLGWLFGG